MQYRDAPEDFVRLLDEAGLRLVGVYSGANFIFPDVLGEELARIELAAQLAGELGAQYLVVGGGAQRTEGTDAADYERLTAALDAVDDIADDHGLVATFHPHMTTIAETPEQVAAVLADSRIALCPDTGHIILGGGDPAELIARHADRIRYVHLKDVDPETGNFVPLGEGALNLDAVMAALREADYDGWITIELDAWDNPAGAARANRAVLAEHLLRPRGG
jgi:inosose dehydratase